VPYYPAISATIQRLFGGRQRSRALGRLGTVVGISTAAGPLAGGCSSSWGLQDGWRRVFLINLAIGAAGLAAAAKLLPRRAEQEEHGLDPAGTALLCLTLLRLLFPLVEGCSAGWPAGA
jgi:MFS family permease